ncbi:MAG: hypothetical protein AB2812_11520 [Candidatus Sedimenticola endophacoides]
MGHELSHPPLVFDAQPRVADGDAQSAGGEGAEEVELLALTAMESEAKAVSPR